MEYRSVGDSDLRVSVIGLGCPNFGGARGPMANEHIWGPIGLEEARPIVTAALDCGVTLFDLADLHAQGRAEQIVGEIVKPVRGDVVLATKWGAVQKLTRPDIRWGSRAVVRASVEASLRRLQADYIDLYTYHWLDPQTPLEETMDALDEVVREGKVRYLGHSHFDGRLTAEADHIARTRGLTRFISAQNRYNVLDRSAESDLFPACERAGVGVLAYFPLGKGLLTGKYSAAAPPPDHMALGGRVFDGQLSAAMWATLNELAAFARARAHSLADLAIAYAAAGPAVACVLTGASRPEQVQANVASASWQLTSTDRADIIAICSRGRH